MNADKTVEIVHVGEPTETQIFGELSAPDDKTFVQRTIGASADGALTLMDIVRFKDLTQRAWPLKKFGEFMAFCNLGKKLCVESQKPAAAANEVFFF